MTIFSYILVAFLIVCAVAAVGAGVTSLLFFMTLKKIHALTEVRGEEEPMWDDEEGEDE